MGLPPPQPIGHFQTHYTYANELAALGHEVTVLSSNPPGSSAWVNAVQEHTPDLSPYENFWFKFHPKVTPVLMMMQGVEDVPPADATIAAVYFFPHEQMLPRELGAHFTMVNGYAELCTREMQHKIWKHAGWKVSIASWLRRLAIREGVPPWEIAHVTNGVDGNTFRVVSPIEERPSRVAVQLAPHVLKGAHFAIEALKLARDKYPQLEAVVFGREERPESLPDWVDYRCRPTRQELVEEVYNRSSVFLCPGVREALNNPSQEAMACGCAVVGTNMGGLIEFARHERNALLCHVRDAPQLADNVVRLLRDPAERIRLAHAGAKTARSRTWQESARRLEFVLTTRVEASRRAGTEPRRAAIEGSGTDRLERALQEVLAEHAADHG